MRLLVDARRLAGRSARLAPTAAALAERGHETWWLAEEGSAPVGTKLAPGGGALSRITVDVALGGSASPLRTAFAGWRTRARVMVLALDGAQIARWGVLDRLAWDTLHSGGLIEEEEADAMRADPRGLDRERLALWSGDPETSIPDVCAADVEILERACERALARQRSRSTRAAVFVDRDGTLVVERGYLSDPDDLELLPGVPAALRTLHAAGYPIIVISNQSGVGRGLFPLSRVYAAMARLRRELRAHAVELDAVYFCPHRPEEGCACRKPGTELLERAADDLLLSLPHSTMIGDKLLDAATGKNAGGRGVLLRTGYGHDEERRIESEPVPLRPDYIAEDLAAAVTWVVATDEASGAT
jgi:histidinol-phosphate phosphatase family protein